MKELDKVTLMRTITECQIAHDECIQKSREFEDLHLTATNYYNQAKVYEYIVECLKRKLKT